MIAILTIVNLCRGDGRTHSIVGVRRCDEVDFWLLFVMGVATIGFSLVGLVCVIRPSFYWKTVAGYRFVEGDF